MGIIMARNNLLHLNAIRRSSAYAHAGHDPDSGSKYDWSDCHDGRVGADRRQQQEQQQHCRSASASSTVPARRGRWV